MTIGIRDLSRNASKVVKEVETTRRPQLVTNNGRPVAALIPIDEDLLEDLVLSHATEFVESRAKTDAEVEAGTTVPAEDVLADLD